MVARVALLGLGLIVAVSASGCVPSRGSLVSLDGGVDFVRMNAGEPQYIIVARPVRFESTPFVEYVKVALDSKSQVDDGSGKPSAFESFGDSAHLPEYVQAGRAARIDCVDSGTGPVVRTIAPAAAGAATSRDLPVWPALMGPRPGVFVGFLTGSGGQQVVATDTGVPVVVSEDASYKFESLTTTSSATQTAYELTAWASGGSTLSVDGQRLDPVRDRDTVFALTDEQLVQVEVTAAGDRWNLDSIKLLGAVPSSRQMRR